MNPYAKMALLILASLICRVFVVPHFSTMGIDCIVDMFPISPLNSKALLVLSIVEQLPCRPRECDTMVMNHYWLNRGLDTFRFGQCGEWCTVSHRVVG